MLKFKLNSAGVREILKSDGVYAECEKYAQKVQETAGAGYVAERRNYPERTGVAVYPSDKEAYYDNLNNNTLEKAFGTVK